MEMITWILPSLLVLAAIIVGITVFMFKRIRRQGNTDKPDYRALFILGVCFFPTGISLSITLENPGFYGMAAMGLIFLIMGITHRDEWKE